MTIPYFAQIFAFFSNKIDSLTKNVLTVRSLKIVTIRICVSLCIEKCRSLKIVTIRICVSLCIAKCRSLKIVTIQICVLLCIAKCRIPSPLICNDDPHTRGKSKFCTLYCDLWPYVLWPLDFQIQKRIVSSETIWGNTNGPLGNTVYESWKATNIKFMQAIKMAGPQMHVLG